MQLRLVAGLLVELVELLAYGGGIGTGIAIGIGTVLLLQFQIELLANVGRLGGVETGGQHVETQCILILEQTSWLQLACRD
tara:strand:- start:35 stop:277 length:243 start_codon:yes stop_codon:yes gene_type:complete